MFYLSYPMTKATKDDLLLIASVRERLLTAPKHYDPARDEPPGLSIADLQQHDLEQMAKCRSLLSIWCGLSSRESRGQNAEIEWAARLFRIPVFVYYPIQGLLSGPEPWTAATIAASKGFVSDNFNLVLEALCHSCQISTSTLPCMTRKGSTRTRASRRSPSSQPLCFGPWRKYSRSELQSMGSIPGAPGSTTPESPTAR